MGHWWWWPLLEAQILGRYKEKRRVRQMGRGRVGEGRGDSKIKGRNRG